MRWKSTKAHPATLTTSINLTRSLNKIETKEGAYVIYTETDFAEILTEVGKQLPTEKQGEFKERLEECAIMFLQNYGSEKRAPPSAIAKQLKAIGNTAKKLTKLTKAADGARRQLHQAALRYQTMSVTTTFVNENRHIENKIEKSSYPSVEDATKAVKVIELYANIAYDNVQKKIKLNTDRMRNKGHASRQQFVNDVAGIYSDMFGELPGASLNPETGRPGGPFIRFLIACYTPLHREFPTLPKLSEPAALTHYRRSAIAKLKRKFK